MDNPACPTCSATDVATYLYGLPTDDPELAAAVKRGDIVLGGCQPFGPDFHCKACGHAWSKDGEPWLWPDAPREASVPEARIGRTDRLTGNLAMGPPQTYSETRGPA